jgi:amino acid adenylation domain-containing protein/non-ribosomal peptide synthase protein (TIGR01720 family)
MKTENIEDLYELSPMQQGMLFHSLAAPESGVYVEYMSCTVQGKLNIPAFKRAWQQVMDRHPVWRTSFYWEGFDKPLQVVNQYVNLPWEQFDWRVLPPVEQQKQLEAFLHAERKRGFELSEAPLMRLVLIQMGEDVYEFIWSHHHLLLDGWSLSLVLKEVFAFYEAFCQGQDLQLKRSRPYRDYIAWLQEQDLAEAEAFWRQALSGLSAPTPLSVDRALGSLFSEVESYDEQEIQLSVEATASLQSLARRHQLTVSTLVQGAWAILLSRYSGQEDVVFGATVSGRPADLAGVESMVGLFINTLPIRVQASPEAFLLDWLKQLQAQQVELRQYEYSSLVQVQGWSDVPRGLPLFDSIVVFENYPVNASLGSPEGRLEFLNVRGVERTNYPLTLVALPGTQLSLQLSYDCRSFDAATITRMLRHLQTLLEGIVANPGQRLKNLPLLTQQERHTLLVDWNDTEVDYPKHLCIHQLFEAQAERTPDAVAVVFEDEQLTYQELNRRANQLAHHLRSLDVGPDSLVGICVERSLKMIVGFLGILKAGGAYVPLDPSYPQERLAFMLKDAQVSVLLTQQQLVEKLPEHQAHLVCLDTEWEAIARQSKEKLVSEVTPDRLAYVIYTSGSTGKPKGVCISHRAVNRLVLNTNYLKLEPSDRVAQASNCSFDAATFEIWGALLHGARLVGVTKDVVLSPKDFVAQLREQGISVLFLTTALFNQLAKEVPSAFNSVRHLLFGGEAVDPRLVKMVLENSPPQRLLHVYGPTESTTFASWHLVQEVPEGVTTIPIGRPLSNTQIYLLDNQMHPVPVGVPGELYIGGDGLARGYLNRPELTAERFILNPFSNEPGAHLYKTGDLARYQPDGNIEFLGRLDDQVKIRGFRIELGEIEGVLGQHPAVDEAVVVVREDVPGNKRLVAYLVVNQATAPTIPELQQFLKQKMPDYMVPSAFVLMNVLPLTPNGKIDRRALPAPDTTRPEGEGAYVPPQTPVEEMVAGIWADVLAVKQVSIHDNFFDLGGHSLLATQLISRLRDTFCVEFPLRGLFDCPTVAGLSERLEQFLRTELLVVPPLLPVSRFGEMLLSFAQARLWFLEQLEPGSSAYNIPSAVRLTGSLHVAVLEQSLNEIVQRHEVLRTTFAVVSGEPIQVIAPVLALTIPRVDLRNLPEAQQEAQVERLATEEAQQPFDLAKGPLLRATLLHLDEAEHVLLLTMHHIVSDGWSMGVLIRELAALYEAFSTGKPSPLPELPIQYADFAHWQRQWLQGEVLTAQLSYWQQQLTGAPALLELPTDRPRPAVQTFRGATQFLALPEPLSQKLKTLSQRSGVTLFMTLLAAFQTLLYRYTGQEDICIGSPIANRNRSETEELIGFFVNTLVLRADMSENPSFQELLSRVREVTLGAYAHQDLPFEQLVEALQPERNLSHQPLFQVMFALQNAPMPALELPNLTLSSLEIESGTAKFDLTLSMEDTEQGLVGSLEYNTDLFHGTTISRMLGHFQTLLEGIVAEPEQRLSDLPLLTQPERQQLLVEWNGTQAAYPKDVCIHQLFEAQVDRTPEAVAVVFENQQLTYGELNRRANQVAHHLRSLGVSPDDLVGICVERSLELVVGLLGILKAGAAYVPLDPGYPIERLAFMLEDALVPVLLTQQRLVDRLPKHGAKTICLDADWRTIAQKGTENPSRNVKADNLAYVIYTSGSTGKPKGVQIEHQGLLNLVFWHQRAFSLSPADRATQIAGPAFDAAVWELWPYLTAGASIYIANEETRISPVPLRDWLIASAITITFLPTPLAESVLSLDWPSNIALRTLLTGGDKLHNYPSPSLPFKLVNNYGPTENTVVTTSGGISSRELIDRTPTIGRPIANTQVYLLDKNLQPVPIGIPGEIYVGGAGLARGYLNHPDLTALAFISNPFSNTPSRRLYKTGDLARYLPEGNIEFLGRLDDQVKIRGFRIELGEIEAVLGQHPAVAETVVVVREDIPGNKRLVAYLVTKESLAPSMQELHRFLKQQLPEYMVPSAFVLLDALPLTANGKVDRLALPAPDTTRPELAGTYVAPQSSVEELLAGIWTDVLGLEKVGIHDNFFELGGDSILSIQIVARANQAGLRLTPKQLFGHQTIAELATVAGTTSVFQAEQGLVTGEVPLTPIQQWFFEQEFAEPHHWNQATLLKVPPTLDLVLLQRVVQQLLIHHDALRLRFVRSASGWQQENAFPDEAFSCTRVDLSSLPKGEQAPAIEATASELQASLNLELGPIVRVALFDLGSNQPNRLLFVIHHLAVDGVSWRILLEDFQTGYQQLSREGVMKLPPKTTSFQNWAQCLTEYAQSPALEQELDYWLDSSRSAVAPLPVDYLAGKEANTVASACNVSVSLSAEETRALLQEVPKAYHTQINDVLLTSMVQAFAQWTGTRCLLVNLEGHGREEILEAVDLSRTVGWFTTIFPVVLELQADAPGEALKSVKEQLRRIPNRGIGYGLLRYLKKDAAIIEKLRALPQAEVSFNYLGQFDRVLSPDGLFELAKESSGSEHSQRSIRSHLLEVNGSIVEGQLQLNWTYSSNLHQQRTIEGVAQNFVATLRSLITHCQSPEIGGYTPSDFPEINLNQEKLDEVLAEIDLGSMED